MSVPYLGDFAEDATVYMPFNTFDSNDPSASVTITNLADADIKVHKDGSVTQIVTDGATVAIDFDGITGNHLFTIDTSVHADYATGSDYLVRMEGTTIDGATVNAWIGHFSIENRYSAGALRPTTAGRTLDVAATGEAGIDFGNIAGTLSGGEIAVGAFAAGAITAAAIATDAIGAAELADAAVTKIRSVNNQSYTIDTGGTSTLIDAALTEGVDHWNDGYILFTSGGAAGQVRIITDFNDVSNTLTYTPSSKTTSAGDTYEIIPAANLNKTLKANVVEWDGSAVAVPSVAGVPEVDVTHISADSTAADNLELDYDGTGYDKANSTIGTTTTNTDMRGTDNAALASVLGALADAAAAGDPTSVDTVMQYLKQIVNTLEGTAGIPVFPAEAAPGNAVSLAEVIRAIHADVTGLNGDAMRGTDSAATAAALATAQADLDIITDADGVVLGAAGVNLIYDEAMTETTGAPAVTGTFRDAWKWMFALSRNKVTQTATTTTLRNDADAADLATATVSDDGTTYTRGEWST